MNDDHTIQALRVLLATAARLYATGPQRTLQEFKRALWGSIDVAAASSSSTGEQRLVMDAALKEIALLSD